VEDLLADTLTPANIHKRTRIDGETPSSFCHPPVTPGSTSETRTPGSRRSVVGSSLFRLCPGWWGS